MSKVYRPIIINKVVITYLDDIFKQSQAKQEKLKVKDECHQFLLKEKFKAASDKSHFWLTRVRFLGHIFEGTTIQFKIPN